MHPDPRKGLWPQVQQGFLRRVQSRAHQPGLAEKPDGTYEGIEVKSGSAYCDARQREFDDAVNSGGPATANLNGRTIQITSVEVVRVP